VEILVGDAAPSKAAPPAGGSFAGGETVSAALVWAARLARRVFVPGGESYVGPGLKCASKITNPGPWAITAPALLIFNPNAGSFCKRAVPLGNGNSPAGMPFSEPSR
jgi:hypothetical protein